MNRIMVCTEQMFKNRPSNSCIRGKHLEQVDPITSAVTFRASNIAEDIGAKLVVVASKSGNIAWVKATQRNYIHTLAVSNNPAALRRMCLYWGIMPLYVESMAEPQAIIEQVIRWGKNSGLLSDGDRVVFVSGSGIFEKTHNLLSVHEV